MRILRSRLPASLALAVVGGAIAWALAGLPGGPAACPAPGCDCESPAAEPIRQPANAWSSLALAAAGIILLRASPAGAGEARPQGAERETPVPNPPPTGEARPQGAEAKARRSRTLDLLAAWALVFAGSAAFLFHAGLTSWAARLDGVAVAVLIATLVASSLPRGSGGGAPAGSGGGNTHPHPSPNRGGAPAGSGGQTRRLRPPRHLASAWLPWLLLGLGGLCWALGRSGGPWCRPDSLLQAHAAWHLLAASSLFLWLRRRRHGPDGASPIPPHPLPSRREELPADEPAP